MGAFNIFNKKTNTSNGSDIVQQESSATITDPAVKPLENTVPTTNFKVEVPQNKNGNFECEEVDVINLHNLNQSFKTSNGTFTLFDNFNLDIKDFKNVGQFISIMGQSGCGKSQLLKVISGLNKPQSGSVKIYGKEQTDKDAIPMVFQQYSSFPWMSVLDNIALPLKMKGISKSERTEKAMEMVKIVGLEGHENKWAQYPILSGGQLQRVSIGRALIANSQILLLDEFSSGLDIRMKREIQDTLLDVYYNSKLDPTVINVTHDILEAVYCSNRIYILSANPCKIHTVIDIDFGVEKRTYDLRETQKFKDYVSLIEKVMSEINN